MGNSNNNKKLIATIKLILYNIVMFFCLVSKIYLLFVFGIIMFLSEIIVVLGFLGRMTSTNNSIDNIE